MMNLTRKTKSYTKELTKAYSSFSDDNEKNLAGVGWWDKIYYLYVIFPIRSELRPNVRNSLLKLEFSARPNPKICVNAQIN